MIAVWDAQIQQVRVFVVLERSSVELDKLR
jgi:hypothetical protein